MEKFLLLILLVTCINISCNNKENKENQKNETLKSQKNSKKYELVFRFKKGIKKKYSLDTIVSLNSIKLKGLSKKQKQDIYQFTNNKDLLNAEIKINQHYDLAIIDVKKDKSAVIERKVTKVTFKDLRLNKEPYPFPLLPYNLPIDKAAKPIKMIMSQKGKIIKMEESGENKKMLGAGGEKLQNKIIGIVNNYMKLPNHKIAIGENWQNNIKEKIALNDLFKDSSGNSSVKGFLKINLKINNKLAKADQRFFYLDYSFAGNILFDIELKNAKLNVIITIVKGQGKNVIDQKIGLEHSTQFTGDFKLFVTLTDNKKTNIKLATKGKLKYLTNSIDQKSK